MEHELGETQSVHDHWSMISTTRRRVVAFCRQLGASVTRDIRGHDLHKLISSHTLFLFLHAIFYMSFSTFLL